MQQTVFIKGMVCNRCITTVTQELKNLGIELDEVNLGEVKFAVQAPFTDYEGLNKKLAPLGFSVLENKRRKLVKEVKQIVADVYSGEFDFPHHFRFSDLLAQKLGKDYDFISQQFSAEEGTTIEKFVIEYRIEKIKELLVYTSLTLADISFQLGFSSVAHLSRQFKQQTGLNPSHFKAMRQSRG
ncbi:AraC family transcriptional regulator [Lacibacter sp. H375]|uniref:AraC family transcriptional regulator n=1 Tax=Lacibacter sp. H375 TaxID=3133424 RepID=UPI0030C09006